MQSWVLELFRDLRLQKTPSVRNNDQIFSTIRGGPVNSDYLARQLKRILVSAELPGIRLYDLRHTAASLALAAGVPTKVISEQLGHSTTAFTLDVYAHLLPNMQNDAAKRVESMLWARASEDVVTSDA